MMGSHMRMKAAGMVMDEAVAMAAPMEVAEEKAMVETNEAVDTSVETPQEEASVQVRENLNETAFFYPQLNHLASAGSGPYEGSVLWYHRGIVGGSEGCDDPAQRAAFPA